MYFIPGACNKHIFPSHFGAIVTPTNHDSGSSIIRIKRGWRWICDNGAFTGKFEPERFFAFLEKMHSHRDSCVFVVAPDVLHRSADGTMRGDAVATLAQFKDYAPRIRKLGYPVAYVAQDGAEHLPFPRRFDALFVGGSTEWKLGEGAEECIKRAQKLGKWVHVGRVNSRKRIQHFALLNVDSLDGTHIVFKPDVRIKELIRWTAQAAQPLFYL